MRGSPAAPWLGLPVSPAHGPRGGDVEERHFSLGAKGSSRRGWPRRAGFLDGAAGDETLPKLLVYGALSLFIVVSAVYGRCPKEPGGRDCLF